MHTIRNILAITLLLLGPEAASVAQEVGTNSARADVTGSSSEKAKQQPDTDLLALMTGTCSTLKVAGQDFACRTVAYVHSLQGRVYFTVALDDAADKSHIISFSGENGQRTAENLYDLTVDRMLLNSNDRPKVDGLPVPAAVTSAGRCVQLGNFALGHVSSVVCSATDAAGKEYRLRFESDGSPITIRRVNPSAPTIRQSS
jgi:hypothetical protein